MITWKKVGTALLVASLISSVLAPAAMAASKKKVGKIYLTIDSDIRTGRDGGDVEVTATGDNTGLYYVDSWEVTNDDGDTWSSSKPPQVDIILGVEDEEEYYFSNTSSSNFKLTLGSSSKYRFDKIKFVNAKRKDSNATLILTVQLVFDKDADTSAAAAPSNLQWDSAHNGNGSWNEVSSAKYYQTQLIKNGAAIGEIKDIYNTSYDFREQITAPGTYQFKVRSVKSSNSAKSSWNTSGSWTVSEADIAALGNTVSDNSQPAAGTWQTAADGRWWYSNADGSYPVSSWQQINGQWYYFDAEVDIILGVEDEEEYYFSNTSSSNFKLTLGSSSKYRFDKIKFVNAKRKDSNATLILTVQLVFDKDADTSAAAAPSNLQWDSAHNGNGSWNEVSSAKYYQTQLIKNGAAIGEIKDIYNTSYDFREQITAPGTYQFKVRSVKSSNSAKSSWNTSGSWTVSEADIAALGNTVSDNSQPAAGTWQTAADGRWWYSNADGSYPVSSWQQINGQWYYFDAEGYMATGWIELDGKSYYLDPSTGAMYANTRTPDNFWVDASGVWIPGM